MATLEIITIGDELLIGQVIDTNSAWMASQLNDIGIRVRQITSVSDREAHITGALDAALAASDIVLLTGGLGPTRDDLTKYTLCRYFKSNLRFDQEVFLDIERIFRQRGVTVTDTNRKQAEVPEKCTVIRNPNGTAPGMWFERDGKVIVSMPGVPHEMKAMMQRDILPQLQQRYGGKAIFHKTVLTQGIGESFLSDLIREWEDQLPGHIRLAYLPSPGQVRLRLTATGDSQEALQREVEEEVKKLRWLADDFIYGYDDDTLEKVVGDLLRGKGATVSTAESCTGGYIAHRLTGIPGSSDYFAGTVVAYANRIKESLLDVPAEMIAAHGAVSEAVARAMAEGAARRLQTTYAMATTGIAGPSGAVDGKPVGTVWIAVSAPGKTMARRFSLGEVRARVIIEASQHAMNMLRRILIGKHAYDESREREEAD
jgi:nicotinamide-nucleotide amidase